jgi:hypothetical protein
MGYILASPKPLLKNTATLSYESIGLWHPARKVVVYRNNKKLIHKGGRFKFTHKLCVTFATTTLWQPQVVKPRH